MSIQIFEVGGSIRDNLLGIENPPDRDFCAVTTEGWNELLTWANHSMEKVFQVREEFFTIRGTISNQPIDIVMCRKDGFHSDNRRPDSVEPGSLLDDLARRDFTVNAMAREVSIQDLSPIGDIIDPFEGQKHLAKKTLICVGETKERIAEDNLRLLRAIRFAITKDFNLSSDLIGMTHTIKPWLDLNKNVSQERIRQELHKIFKHDTKKAMKFIVEQCNPIALNILFKELWLKPTSGR